MARYPGSGDVTYSFGPGAPTPVVKLLLIANVAIFLVSQVVPLFVQFGLSPAQVFEQFTIWQPVTYMFLHGGLGHLLFNMLALWMFGTELERTWRSRFFTKYYFVTGIGAALTTLLWSISPLPLSGDMYYTTTVGASGAIYGLLLAYAVYFPHRTIFLLVFPIQAKYYAMIVGAIAFLYSIDRSAGGVAHTAHLGGLVVGYLYLKGLRGRPLDEIKYRWLRWKMNRARSKFGVYSGGRDDDWKNDWKKHIH